MLFRSEFLALRRNTSLLLAALVLAGTGEKLWLGFAPRYIETLGGGVLVIGLFDALQTWLGAVYAYPGGWLTDRFGLSWQVIPREMQQYLGGPDPNGARRAMQAMLEMQRLGVADLRTAYEGA